MTEPFDQFHKQAPAPDPQRAGSPSPDAHTLWVVGRSEITVKGVTDVHSFDEGLVDLDTVCGRLTLEGRDLHVVVLDTKGGVVSVTGQLTGLLYEDTDADPSHAPDKAGKTGGRRFPRLFR